MKIEAKANVSILSVWVANLRKRLKTLLIFHWSCANGLWVGTLNVPLLSDIRTVGEQFQFFSLTKVRHNIISFVFVSLGCC